MADGIVGWANGQSYTPAQARWIDSLLATPVNAIFGRSGLRAGPGLVVTTGGSSPEQVTVTGGSGIIYDPTPGGGSYHFIFPAGSNVKDLPARPAAGTSRYIEVCVRLNGTPDTDVRDADIVLVTGAAAASPSYPTIPANHVRINTLLVPASGAITVLNRGPRTVALGGILPVSSAAERDGAGSGVGVVFREDLNRLERRSGGGWVPLRDATLSDWVTMTKASALNTGARHRYRVLDDGKVRVEISGAGAFTTGGWIDVTAAGAIPSALRPDIQATRPCTMQALAACIAVTPAGTVQVINMSGASRSQVDGVVEYYPAGV